MTQITTPAPGTRGSDTPHPVDVHVGHRLKLRRTLMGLTQGKLGESIGLTFQQIQKYERGANRVSASKLWQLGNVLDVPVSFFFEDMSESLQDCRPLAVVETAESATPKEHLTLHRRQTLELVRAFSNLSDKQVRKRVLDVVNAIAASEQNNAQPMAVAAE